MKTTIRYPSSEATKILWDTYLTKDSSKYKAIPKELTMGELVLDLVQENQIDRPIWIKRWAVALRAISLTSMFIPTLTTYLFLSGQGLKTNTLAPISGIIIPCLLLLAVNVLNDVQDHLRLIDMQGSIGGSGVIQKGWLTPKQLTLFAVTSIALALILSIPFLVSSPTLRWMIAPVTLMVVIGYSGKPFSFKYRALGDLVVFLCCGPVLTIGYSLAVFNTTTFGVGILGTFYGLLACTIVHANNMNDINTDTKNGAKTMASALGFHSSKYLMVFYYLAASICLGYLAYAKELSTFQVSIILITLIPTWKLLRLIFNAKEPEDKSIEGIRFITPQIHLLTGILLCLSISFISG